MTVNGVVVAFVFCFIYETIKKLCIIKNYEPVTLFLLIVIFRKNNRFRTL